MSKAPKSAKTPARKLNVKREKLRDLTPSKEQAGKVKGLTGNWCLTRFGATKMTGCQTIGC